jgi:hypothetical protein
MSALLQLLAILAAWSVVWRLASRHFIGRGYNRTLSHVGGASAGLLVAAVVLVAIVPSSPAQSADTAAVAQPPAAVATEPAAAASVAKAASAASEGQADSATLPPMDLLAARRFAKGTLKVIDEAQQSLQDAIQLRDKIGIMRFVIRPLDAELERWPTLVTRHQDDQRQHFDYCRHAALMLQNLAHSVGREQTVESLKYVRKDEAAFNEAKQQCVDELKVTDQAIAQAAANEEAELKRKFGGRECLTVMTVDKATGQIAPKPKPAHCPK